MAGGDTLSRSALELRHIRVLLVEIGTLLEPAERGAESIFALLCRESTGMNVPPRIPGAQLA